MPVLDCDLEALVPFVPTQELPWDTNAVLHVYRRLGYGLSPSEVPSILQEDPVSHLNAKIQAAATRAPLDEPTWGYWDIDDYNDQEEIAEQILLWRSVWTQDLRANSLRSKMVLFWSNHFVTGLNTYQCPSHMWQYHDLLQRHAFGDFRDFVREIGTTPAMLVYLNGLQNNRFEPNENYARELFELFTLGEGNGYTQANIEAAARVLTGYNGFTTACGPINFTPQFHDDTPREIFSSDPADFVSSYDELIDHIFEFRGVECSEYICGRIYRHFVSTELDAGVVSQLASTLRNNNWNLTAVYQQLFSSAHFFSLALRGTRFKDPFELLLGTERLMSADDIFNTDEGNTGIWFQAGNLGQILFNPPDVAGWPGDRAWVSANFLSLRGQVTQQVVFLVYENNRLRFIDWARSIGLSDERNVDLVAREIADFVLPQGLPDASDYQRVTETMKGEVPSYYFDNNLWSLDFEFAPEQIALTLDYLLRRPEFQLC